MIRVAAVCGVIVAAAAGLVLPSTVAGASVVLRDPSPPDGAVFPTQEPPYRVPLFWTVDISGCAEPHAQASVVVRGSDGLTTRGSLAGNPPSGGRAFVATVLRRTTYRWYVEVSCAGLGPVRSETRGFTLVGPNPEPRLHGRYKVEFPAAAVVEVWRFRSRCAAGACSTRVKRPGAPWAVLRYDPRRRIYRGTLRKMSRAPEAVCTLPPSGQRSRTARKTYRGRSLTLAIRVRRTSVNGATTQRLAALLSGSSRGVYVPNTRGKKLGCRAGRVSTSIRVTQLA